MITYMIYEHSERDDDHGPVRVNKLKYFTFQSYLVAGGCRQWNQDEFGMDIKCVEYLASAEVYRGGQWVTVEPLPAAVMGVRGATVDNTVYMTGSKIHLTLWSLLQKKYYLHTSFLKVAQTMRINTGQRSGDTLLRAAPGHWSST